MKIGSLFSGIGGLELGLERAGVGEVIWQCEVEPFCLKVLEKHWPHAKRYGDIKELAGHRLEPVEVLCGGFPCQDVSSAGLGAGLHTHTRSGLWFEYRRLIGELRPKWVVVENVASGKRRWLHTVRRDLHVLGYGTRAFALSAAEVGAPHLRRRVFVLAHADLLLLRQQSRRSEGTSRSGAAFTSEHGEEGAVSDSHPEGEHACAEHGEVGRECPATTTTSWNGWETIPEFRRVDDGVSEELDESRLMALGNAVVPQCAEVIGRILMDLAA